MVGRAIRVGVGAGVGVRVGAGVGARLGVGLAVGVGAGVGVGVARRWTVTVGLISSGKASVQSWEAYAVPVKTYAPGRAARTGMETVTDSDGSSASRRSPPLDGWTNTTLVPVACHEVPGGESV